MTGVQGFTYDMRTALLPFLFIFNTELLLIDVTLGKAIFVFFIAVIAMMLFASATQGYLFTHNRKWESLVFLLIAFTLFRPGYWLDQVSPPFNEHQPTAIYEVVEEVSPNGDMRVIVTGPDFDTGKITSTTILVNLGQHEDAVKRLREAGLTVIVEDGRAIIEEPFPGTPFFESIGKSFDYYADEPVRVDKVLLPAERMPKEVFYIPAIILLAFVMWSQKRRIGRDPEMAKA